VESESRKWKQEVEAESRTRKWNQEVEEEEHTRNSYNRPLISKFFDSDLSAD
jgi:hypothetical protein